ncbi:MAG: transposase family protein [Candidatus Dormibacteraceae bacterium]
MTVETTSDSAPRCPNCGTKVRAVGRYPVLYRDLPSFGMSVRLIWTRRRWQCPNPSCGSRTRSEESDQIAPGTTLTKRVALGFKKFTNYRLRVLLRTGGVTGWRRPTPSPVYHPATGF